MRKTKRLWDCVWPLDVDSPVNAVAVIPDRRIIVAGDALGRVHFFDFVEP